MLEFFKALYGNCDEGYISLWGKGDTRKPSVHVPVGDIDKLVLPAEALDLAGLDVYFGVALRGRDLGISQRGKDEDCTSVPGYWVDIDYGTVGHAAKNLPASAEEAMDLLDAAGIDPTVLVDSGGGLHAYVLFTEPFHLTDNAARSTFRRENEALQKRVVEAAKARGQHADLVADIARVLRVPGTVNRKAGLERPVRLLLVDGPRIAPPQVTASRPRAEAPTAPQDVNPRLPTKSMNAARSAVTEALKRIRKPELRELAQAIVNGTPFSEMGKRDADFQRICSVIADMDPDTDPSELAKVFRGCIDATAERDADWQGEEDRVLLVVEDKISRAQGKVRAKRADTEEMLAMFSGTPKAAPTVKVNGEVREVPDKELIILRGDAHYIYAWGEYQPPKQKSELKTALQVYWKDHPSRLTFVDDNGDPVRRNLDQIFEMHAQVADEIVADLRIPTSYFDTKSRIFYEAVGRLRDLQPEFNARIDEWLRIMAGPLAEKLLDWAATIPRLDKYNTALCLLGARGAGKNVFANGVARLFTLGGPTEMKRVIESFNSDLLKCPIVFADEEIPSSQRGTRNTAQLREMVTSMTRTLSRKFLPNADLVGAIRLIILANDASVLAIGDEDLSREDLDAFGDRFLHIEVKEDARHYLESMRDGEVDTWIMGDKIARHVLWLAQNREVKPGKRFLVENSHGNVKRVLATKGKFTALACEMLARHLDSPKPLAVKSDKLLIGGGGVMVNAAWFIDHWEDYLPHHNAPSLALMGRAINHLSRGVQRFADGRRFHKIDVAMFIDWCDANQVGNLQRMNATINAPLKATLEMVS